MSIQELPEQRSARRLLLQRLELLRLHDVERAGQLFGRRHRVFDRGRRNPLGDADAEFSEQFLGLIFVQIHG